MGSPEFSIPSLKKLIETYSVEAVFTQPPKAAGRGMKLRKSQVQIFSEKHKIKVFHPNNLSDNNIVQKIKNIKPDFLIVVAYGLILPKTILEIPRFAPINGHASLLPKWRGSAPIQRSIEAGEKQTGCTTILMEPGLDTGPIILQRNLDILDKDDNITIQKKLSELTSLCILNTIDKFIKNKIKLLKQDENKVTYAKKLLKSESFIKWELSSKDILNKLRAFRPYPGLTIKFHSQNIKLIDGDLSSFTHNEKPGYILSTKNEIIVACGYQTSFLIKSLQKSGKKILSSKDFLLGNKIKIGDFFE